MKILNKVVKTSEYWKTSLLFNSGDEPEYRKLGIVGREQKKTIRCKDGKKISIAIVFLTFYLLITSVSLHCFDQNVFNYVKINGLQI